MVFGRFRKKSSQPRGPDGKFLSPGGDGSGSATVAARGMSGDLAAVTKTLNEAFTLTNTIQEQALKGMEMRARHRDMMEDLEGSIEAPDGGMDFEQMAMQVIMQQLANSPQAKSSHGDPFGEGIQMTPDNTPHAYAIPQAVGDPPQPEPPTQGVDRLNQVLRALNKIPDKVISDAAINKVCEMEGINQMELKGVIKKLAPVIK